MIAILGLLIGIIALFWAISEFEEGYRILTVIPVIIAVIGFGIFIASINS